VEYVLHPARWDPFEFTPEREFPSSRSRHDGRSHRTSNVIGEGKREALRIERGTFIP
jgi:hypothetical protein